MISYATVEKIDSDTIKMHIEMYPIFCAKNAHRKWKKTYIVYDEKAFVNRFIPDVAEGDVLIVEHYDDSVISYLEKDEDEKIKRREHLKRIFQRFHH